MNAASMSLLVGVLVLGCGASDEDAAGASPQDPGGGGRGEVPSVPSGPTGGMNAVYDQILSREPSFGGVYVGADGKLVVLLTDMARFEGVVRAVVEAFGAENVSARLPASAAVVKYDYAQLWEWKIRMRDVFLTGVTHMLAVDEKRNVVLVGVRDAPAIAEVERFIAGIAVPREGVVVEVVEPFRPLAD